MKKSNNAGFTLMELILVIIIMGIAASFIYLSISNVGASAAKEAASDTNYLLSRCRAACLSRAGENYLKLYLSGEKLMAEYSENGQTEQQIIADGRVSCTYTTSANASAVPVSAEGIKISFDRSSGAETTDIETICFSGGGSEHVVYIVPGTGSHGIGSEAAA